MSGRSTPLAGYPEQYRMEGKMGWLAAFGTSSYPDGILFQGFMLNNRTTPFGGIRRQFWTYQIEGTCALSGFTLILDSDCAESVENCRSPYYGRH